MNVLKWPNTVVQSLNRVQLFVTRWTATHQAPLFSTIAWNLFKFMSIELVMLSNHLILCCPLLLLPSVFPSIREWVGSLQWVAKILELHLILCCPLLLLPSIFPRIRVFSNESVLCIRWLKYWSFSFSNSPPNEYSGFISFRIDCFEFLVVHGPLKNLL